MKAILNSSTLQGEINAVSSKSAAHRAFICAALSDKITEIVMKQSNADIDTTIDCLRSMGAEISLNRNNYSINPIKNIPTNAELKCGESGSTLRFLLPVAAAVLPKASFFGSGRLPQRPIKELMDVLRGNGVQIDADSLPFSISGKLKSGIYEITGNISSQYISGLLMALPLLDGESNIVLKSVLSSAPYVDITIDILSKFGIDILKTDNGYSIHGNQIYCSPKTLEVEGDWSGAAFYLASGALNGKITVSGLRLDSKQGDKAIAELLKKFGADVNISGDSVTVKKSKLNSCEIDVSEIPDLFPILAVLATKAEGKTVLFNASNLRLKESDRITAVAKMIKSLGGNVTEYPDRLDITNTELKGGIVDSYNDHRIVMSAAIAAALCQGETTIYAANAVNKSYPSFFEDYSFLGGKVSLEDIG